MKFQLSRRTEEPCKPTSRCRRCGTFIPEDHCDTHKRIMGLSNSTQNPAAVTLFRPCHKRNPYTVTPSQNAVTSEQDTTPIRATFTAEKAAEKGAVNQEKGKNDLKGRNEKNNKGRFQQGRDLRRSSRIRSAKRTEKLEGIENF